MDFRKEKNCRFDKDEVLEIANGRLAYSKSLDGLDFVPGTIGMNTIKNADYLNVLFLVHCLGLIHF